MQKSLWIMGKCIVLASSREEAEAAAFLATGEIPRKREVKVKATTVKEVVFDDDGEEDYW